MRYTFSGLKQQSSISEHIWGFFIISYGIAVLILSRFENRKDYALQFIIIGIALRIAGWVGYIFAGELWHLYAIQIIFALGQAAGSPSYNNLYSSYLTRGKFASDWGVDHGVSALITGSGALAGGIIVFLYGFSLLFSLMIGLSIISIIIAVLFRNSIVFSK